MLILGYILVLLWLKVVKIFVYIFNRILKLMNLVFFLRKDFWVSDLFCFILNFLVYFFMYILDFILEISWI